MSTRKLKIKDLNPVSNKPYGVYSRFEEYLNLLMNAVKVVSALDDKPLNYEVETFLKRGLFENGAMGYDKIREKDIDEITERRAKRDDRGNIDAKLTLQRDLDKTERNIRRYQYALGAQQNEIENNMREYGEDGTEYGDGGTGYGMTEPEEKPKWYQFIKRIKNWIQNRKQERLDPGEDDFIEPETVEVSEKRDGKHFRTELARAALDRKTKTIFREGKDAEIVERREDSMDYDIEDYEIYDDDDGR